MDFTQEERQREEFRNILFDLAESQFSLKDKSDRSKMYQRLERLYYSPSAENRYRHFYSDIFIVLTAIQQGDRPGAIDILGQNLAEIRRGYQPLNTDEAGKPIDIRDSLKKLYDHVSLDIARINYSDWADRKVEQKESISQVKAEVAAVQSNIDKAREDMDAQVDTIRDVVQDTQKNYITILGIFASIVLAFTGGIAFSTSVLENMHLVSAYRVIIVSLIIGLVLVNVLYGLFYYISKLIIKKDEQRLLPLLITNAILLLLIALTVIAWKNGYIEERNQALNESSPIEAVEQYKPEQYEDEDITGNTTQVENGTSSSSETSQ